MAVSWLPPVLPVGVQLIKYTVYHALASSGTSQVENTHIWNNTMLANYGTVEKLDSDQLYLFWAEAVIKEVDESITTGVVSRRNATVFVPGMCVQRYVGMCVQRYAVVIIISIQQNGCVIHCIMPQWKINTFIYPLLIITLFSDSTIVQIRGGPFQPCHRWNVSHCSLLTATCVLINITQLSESPYTQNCMLCDNWVFFVSTEANRVPSLEDISVHDT